MNSSTKRKIFFTNILGCFMLLVFNQLDFTRRATKFQVLSSYVTDLRAQNGTKYILIWTNPDKEPIKLWGPGQEQFIKRKCKVNSCYVTPNRTLLQSVSQFDAIAFHGPDIKGKYLSVPKVRSMHQKYVFVSMESSHYYPICDKNFDGFFNWTWTYRLDSDESYGYITIRNITGDIIGPNKIMNWVELDSMKPIDKKTKAMLDKKNKTAAWFVSNCNSLSKREKYVEKLQNELKKYGLGVDVFGACRGASHTCPRTIEHECFKMVQEEYYFYLSLENSFSEDYVTEKLLTALQNYAVPVVFGGANYTRFMPDGIYLHGGEIMPSDLAKEMNDIIKDKDRYYNFFKWRNHYSYHPREEAPDSDGLCRICEMLHDETLVTKETVHKDIRNWWNGPEACSPPAFHGAVYMIYLAQHSEIIF
ncbi:alpha-(1,3)-fucosyltransferase C-like [Leguminivora glycinivorella]|uniref:alpha-(1,3)-fucosyltransferase C-like n=1 Tax=Leguminivora glycinivorella TaxID=1035111 RepID=UPI00201005FE|nr:alpha-(1,3)-fucosyltransferase C-like [Leguminivora glycinivorella]